MPRSLFREILRRVDESYRGVSQRQSKELGAAPWCVLVLIGGRETGARIRRGVRCADAGPNTRVPKNTPDASRTSRPLNLAFSRNARPEGFTIRCPVQPRMSGSVGQPGPKTLPPGEPFPPRGLSDSRAHDPEGPERAIHAPSKRVWLQSQNLPAVQIPVDNELSYTQFILGFSTGPFRATTPAAARSPCCES